MNYQQALDYMYASLPMYQRIGKAAYKANLDNTHKLDHHFGQPHKKFQSIHIAGTNGKGSVSHMLASVFQESGLNVGLYTSPHLLDFRERIRINGELITKAYVAQFISENRHFFDQLEPSFFEITVALAYKYFADLQVDVAIVETGLGGRLDSTNILHPLASVITNIGFDHTHLLGNTLAEIATEKAGIIKPQTKVIIGEMNEATAPVFDRIAASQNAPIAYANQQFMHQYALYNPIDDLVEHHYLTKPDNQQLTLSTDLKGSYQRNNLATCMQVLEALKDVINIPEHIVLSGLTKVSKNTGLRGRWEICGNNPLTVCDTGHNFEGLGYIVEQIRQTAFRQLHLVLGFVDEKDIARLLKLFPFDANYYLCESSVARTAKIAQLNKAVTEVGLSTVKIYPNVASAVHAAQISAASNDFIFIGGSTFVVADYLHMLSGQ